MTKEQLAQRMRAIRRKMGLSQIEFESLCGMQEGYLSRLERGVRSPSFETLCKIADGAGLTLSQLLAEDEPQAAQEDETIRKILAYAKKLKPETRKDVLEIIKIFERNQG